MSQEVKKSGRNPSLDVLRIFAFLLVVSVHFGSLSKYNQMATGGLMMLLMTMVRAVTICCVPIFIMLTGYLQTNKTVSAKFYGGILRPGITYILAALVCLIYKIKVYAYPSDIPNIVGRILNFTASDYGWYMEMYFGLFLMIPFLNAAYHGMKNQKQKLILIASFLFLTAIPPILNTFNFVADGWWAMPSLNRTYNKLIPEWWVSIYPITYYFIGSYLREYPLKLNKWVNLLLIGGSAALIGAYNFYRLRGSEFFYGAFLNEGSLLTLTVSVLLFSFIAERDMRSLPSPVQKILSTVSGWTLAAYLVSQLFDVMFYPKYIEAFPVMSDRVKHAPIIVLAVFFCSLILGGIIDSLYRLAAFLIGMIPGKKKVLQTKNIKIPEDTKV